MNCTNIRQQLSAFHDGELNPEERSRVASHLAQCSQCASQLKELESLTSVFKRLPNDAAPSVIWERLSSELAGEESGSQPETIVQPPDHSILNDSDVARWGGSSILRLAVAASILFVVGFGARYLFDAYRGESSHHANFVMTMDHYLKVLSDDPGRAERFLIDKYAGRTVAPEEAVRLVGYRPAVADGLPEGYTLASTSVLKMPCCTCVKAVCRRSDGSTLVLFEHDDEKAAWFGDRPMSMATRGNKVCCLVKLDSSIAATWKNGARSVTAVGVRDLDEVDRLVSWLGNPVESTL